MSGPAIPLSQIEQASLKEKEVSDIEWVYWWFTKQGWTHKDFMETPLPYIFSVLKAQRKHAKEKKKELS